MSASANTVTLLIDAGNTRIKWTFSYDGEMRDFGDCLTSASFDDLADAVSHAQPQRAVITNVAGADVISRIRTAVGNIAFEEVYSVALRCGVTNRYTTPAQLGADRFVAMIAAHHMGAIKNHAKLVVMAGTALTVDALTAEGEFLGGVIAPGVTTMRTALNRTTAQLPLAAHINQAHRDFPRDTETAIAVGTVEAAAGLIERRYRALKSRVVTPTTVVVSGGGMNEIVPYLSMPISGKPYLVLDGLAIIAQQAR